jgi:uncharacterized protein (TIRG00374 family)
MTEGPDDRVAPIVERRGVRHLKAAARFAVGLAVLGLVLWWLAPDWAALRATVRFDPSFALVGLLGTTIASFVTAARWRLLAEVMGGTRLSFASYFYALVLTRLGGQFVPTVAMDLVGRGVALRSAGSERGLGHAATQVVLERMFDGLLPILLLGWALSLRHAWLPFDALTSLALICAAFLIFAIPFLRPGVRVALRFYLWARLRVSRRRRVELEAQAETELDATPLVDAKLARQVALLSLARYAAVILQFWGIARAVGVPVSWEQMTAAASVAQLAGLLGLTPGGLGVLEAGWAGGLGWVGLAAEPISLFVLAQRVGIISFFGILTLVSYPIAARDKRSVQARRAQEARDG